MRFILFLVFIFLFSAGALNAQRPAIDSLQKVIKENKNDTAVARAYIALAHVYEKNSPDSAVQFYLAAVNVLQSVNNAGAQNVLPHRQKILSDAYSDLSALYTNQARIVQALDYAYKSLKIREQLDDKAGIAEALNTIALIHHYYLEDLPHALETYLQALKFIKETGDKYGESVLLHNVADIYQKQGDTARALDYYLRSLKMREELGDKQAISNALNSLAILYRERGDLNRAFEYGFKCLELRKEVGDKRGIAYVQKNIGETYLLQGNLAKARELGEQSLQAGKGMGNPDVIEKAASFLLKVYKRQERWKEAVEMNQLYTQMHDSTSNKRNGMIAIRQQVNYEYEKRAIADSLKFIVGQQEKDLQIQQQQAMLSKEKIIRNSVIAISVLILLMVVIVFNNIRVKNKTLQVTKANEIRRKISRDLHDDIGAGLTSISMICEQAKMKSKNKEDDASLLELSDRIRLQTQSVYEKLREVIWATNPENNNLEVLLSYIRNYVSTFFENSSIACTINIPDDAPNLELKPDVSRNLIFVLKEALNNSVKHSNASVIDVSFAFIENKNYSFKITDNGKGIDFESIPALHNGLSYMRRRIEEINGKLEIVSKSGEGTCIEINGSFS